ncbi:MAG: CHAT domain-containing tetratricopeptide repeat protein [Bacteroidota bacterium]
MDVHGKWLTVVLYCCILVAGCTSEDPQLEKLDRGFIGTESSKFGKSGSQGKDLVEAILNQAVLEVIAGYNDSALSKVKPLFEEEPSSLDDENYTKVLNIASHACWEARYLDEAETFAQRAKSRAEAQEPIDSANLIMAHFNLGNIRQWRDEFEQAKEQLQQTIDLRSQYRGEDAYISLADIYTHLAIVDRFQGDYRLSEEKHLKALSLRTAAQEDFHPSQALTYYQLGKTYEALGRYQEAIALHKKSISIFQQHFGPLCPGLAYAYRMKANVHRYLGEYKTAIHNFNRALTIGAKTLGENHPRLASTYNNLGIVYYITGDFDQALAYYQRAFDIQLIKHGEQSSFVASGYQNLGNVYRNQAKYAKSLECYQKSLAIQLAIRGRIHRYVSYLYRSMGAVYSQMGEFEKALEYDKQALEIALAVFGHKHPSVAGSYHDLAADYTKLGRHRKAVEWHLRALEIRKEVLPSGHYLIANSYLTLSHAHIAWGRYDEAKKYNEQAINLLHYDLKRPTDFSQVPRLDLMKYALNDLETFRIRRWETTQGKPQLDSLRELYRYRVAFEDHVQSEYILGATREFYAGQSLQVYERALLNLGRYLPSEVGDDMFRLAEFAKGRQLTERLQEAPLIDAFGIDDDIRKEEETLRISIAKYQKALFEEKFNSRSPNDSLSRLYQDSLLNLQRRQRLFLDQLRSEQPEYYLLRYRQNVIGLDEVAANLLGQTHDALVEYFVGDQTIYTWVVLADTFHILSTKRDFPLEAWIRDLRCALLSEQDVSLSCSSDYPLIAHQLYQKLFASVDSLLPSQASVLLVPDGLLGYLPFEALLTHHFPESRASYAYLLRDHPISYAYSSTLQSEMQRKTHQQPPSRTLLAIAPTFEGDGNDSKDMLGSRNIDTADRRNLLAALTYNVPEAQLAADKFGGDVLTGEYATEAAFVDRASDYRILHLSTHGKANDQAGDYSFLAFHHIEDDSLEIENEWLYNSEIYNLKLNADLVVLSACETGIGELQRGEGIISLARGFSYAGAKSLVTSLWNVNDRSSMELMKSFYGYLAEGMPKHIALRQAKLDYLDTHPDYLQSPYYWAGFIPIGDMEPVEMRSRPRWFWMAALGIGLLVIAVFVYFYRQQGIKKHF